MIFPFDNFPKIDIDFVENHCSVSFLLFRQFFFYNFSIKKNVESNMLNAHIERTPWMYDLLLKTTRDVKIQALIPKIVNTSTPQLHKKSRYTITHRRKTDRYVVSLLSESKNNILNTE